MPIRLLKAANQDTETESLLLKQRQQPHSSPAGRPQLVPCYADRLASTRLRLDYVASSRQARHFANPAADETKLSVEVLPADLNDKEELRDRSDN